MSINMTSKLMLLCGPGINTAEAEEFPTIAPDGSLYFSSKGWTGMGGFDIFHISGSKTQWGTPENLRYPTNSPGDDFYFVAHANGALTLLPRRAAKSCLHWKRVPIMKSVSTIPEAVAWKLFRSLHVA